MTTKADFTDDEWGRVRRAPFVAAMAISIADPGGPIELVKETSAALKAIQEAARAHTGVELVDAVADDVIAEAKQRHNVAKGFKPEGATPGEAILDELRAVDGLVAAKATPEELEAFREWLLDIARRASEAAKEGGFMGFGAVQVSEGEQQMLDRLRQALATNV
jgi:hypothetical protein